MTVIEPIAACETRRAPGTKNRAVCKVNAMSQALLIKALVPGDLTIPELAEECGLHYQTVRQYLIHLHAAGAIHICRWDQDSRGRYLLRVYKLGPGKDAPRVYVGSSLRTKQYRERKRMAKLLGLSGKKPEAPAQEQEQLCLTL